MASVAAESVIGVFDCAKTQSYAENNKLSKEAWLSCYRHHCRCRWDVIRWTHTVRSRDRGGSDNGIRNNHFRFHNFR